MLCICALPNIPDTKLGCAYILILSFLTLPYKNHTIIHYSKQYSDNGVLPVFPKLRGASNAHCSIVIHHVNVSGFLALQEEEKQAQETTLKPYSELCQSAPDWTTVAQLLDFIRHTKAVFVSWHSHCTDFCPWLPANVEQIFHCS